MNYFYAALKSWVELKRNDFEYSYEVHSFDINDNCYYSPEKEEPESWFWCGICVNMVHNLTDRSILPHPWVFAQTWEYSYKNHGGFSYPIEAALDIPHWMHFSTNKWEGERLKYRLLYIDHIIGCIERGTVQPDIPRWEKFKLLVIAFFKGK